MPENWDGYQGAVPVSEVIELAHEFVAFVEAANVRGNVGTQSVQVSPTRTGGVLIEWEDTKFQHEVEINPDNRISFLHVDKGDGNISTRTFSPIASAVVNPGLLQELSRLLAA